MQLFWPVFWLLLRKRQKNITASQPTVRNCSHLNSNMCFKILMINNWKGNSLFIVDGKASSHQTMSKTILAKKKTLQIISKASSLGPHFWQCTVLYNTVNQYISLFLGLYSGSELASVILANSWPIETCNCCCDAMWPWATVVILSDWWSELACPQESVCLWDTISYYRGVCVCDNISLVPKGGVRLL